MSNKKNNLTTAAAVKNIEMPEIKKDSSPIFLYVLAALIFILPLVTNSLLFDPAVANRWFLVVVYVIIFLGLFFFLKPKIDFTITKQFLFVIGLGGAFLVWSIISTIFAINPLEGLLEISKGSTYFILFITVIITVLTNKNAIDLISKIVVFIAIIHSLTGIAQYYDFGGRGLPAGLLSYPFGFNVNRNFYGSFLALLVPFCAYVLYANKSYWQYIAGFAIVVSIGAIIISQTRAAWLSTFMVFVLITVVIAIIFKTEIGRWLKKIGMVVLSSAVFISLLIAIDAEGNLVAQLKDKIFGTIALVKSDDNNDAAKGSAESNAAERIDMAKKSIPLIKDNIVKGVGRNNWKLALGKYGYGDLKAYAASTMIPDFPHNVYVYLTAETGVVGILLFLAFIFSIILLGIKTIKKNTAVKAQTLFLLAGLLGFGIDCLFSFSDSRVEHMLFFAIIIGGIIANYIIAKKESIEEIKNEVKLNRNVLVALGLGILVFNLYVANGLYRFDKHFIQVSALEKVNQFSELLEEAEACKSDIISMGGHVMPVENLEIIAYKGLKKYPEANKAFAIGKKKSPYLAQIYNNIGTSYIEGGEPEKAKVVLQNAISIAPLYAKPKQNLAVVYYNMQQFDSCYVYLKQTDIENPPIFTNMLKTIANDFYSKNEFDKCLDIITFQKQFKSERPWFDSLNSMVKLKIKK
jgi:O-antigen ligase